MDAQQFEYWLPTDLYAPNPNYYTPDLSSIPSLTASPVFTPFITRRSSYRIGNMQPDADLSQTSTIFDGTPTPTMYSHVQYGSSISYSMPMTPSEFGSADESPYCSPRTCETELSYSGVPPAMHAEQHFSYQIPTERTHTTSGRRRAQNRAAQRAFRERKEKHARDLEAQLTALTAKYGALETSHAELSQAYEQLRQTIGVLMKNDDGSGRQEAVHNAGQLKKLLEVLRGEVRGKVKAEAG